jgi:NitT/TauT family transport system permease protein
MTDKKRWVMKRTALQLLLAATILLAWQYLPHVEWVSDRVRWLDPFYISSPSQVTRTAWRLSTGHGTNGVTIWPYLRATLWSTIAGVAIGLALGCIAGVVMSNSRMLAEVVRPFIVLANTVPRIAIIPIFVVVVGPTSRASILSVITVVFFLAFFNAFQGGISVQEAMVDNAVLLGGSPVSIMTTIRLPMVLSWTFAVIPNAIAFGLVIAVATELLAGVKGIGTLLHNAMLTVNADLTFAIISVLSLVGMLLYWASTKLRDRIVHWEQP